MTSHDITRHHMTSLQWQEAEAAYKSAVAECNDCQYQVHVAAQVRVGLLGGRLDPRLC